MTTLYLSFLLIVTLVARSTAQSNAPTPAPSGPVNLTAILDKAGAFKTFIGLLASTQVGIQVESQVNQSTQGMTVFAPTDNAFQTLKAGTINDFTKQQQVQLILYHVLPEFYNFSSFQTASNPVRTQASGNDGKPFVLTVTYIGVNNVNVSTGVVTTQINNALRARLPLAVYQLEKVLLPKELFGSTAKPPMSTEAPKDSGDNADGPSGDGDSGNSGAYGFTSMGFGVVGTVCLVTMVVLF